MTDSRRDFLLRFAATALAAVGGGCVSQAEEVAAPEPDRRLMTMVLYGPAPRRPVEPPSTSTTELFFGGGRLDLTFESEMLLRQRIVEIKQLDAYTITLEGNCDERGTAEYNLALGQRRAEAVKRLLVEAGIAAERITAISFGKERPRDPGHGNQARAHNRRVDMMITRR